MWGGGGGQLFHSGGGPGGGAFKTYTHFLNRLPQTRTGDGPAGGGGGVGASDSHVKLSKPITIYLIWSSSWLQMGQYKLCT